MRLRLCIVCSLFMQFSGTSSHSTSSASAIQGDGRLTNLPAHPAITAMASRAKFHSRCETRCSVHFPQISVLSWVPEKQIVYTEQITVGVIRTTVFMDSNAMATAVVSNIDYRWPGASDSVYPPYPSTDDHYTVWALTAFTNADTTTNLQLAWPNSYVDYATGYSWEGALPTKDEAGLPSCASATAGPSTQHLKEHPTYPQPSNLAKKIREFSSESGIGGFVPLWVPFNAISNGTFFQSAFPLEAAFARCTPMTAPSPTPITFYTPKFFWDHTTITSSDTRGVNQDDSSAEGETATKTCQSPGGQRVARHCLDSNTTGPMGTSLNYTAQIGAQYRNASSHGSGNASIITIIIDNGGGTTTLTGAGPHGATLRINGTLFNSADHRFGQYMRTATGLEALTTAPDRQPPYFVHTVSEVLEKQPSGVAPPLQSKQGWDATLVMPLPSVQSTVIPEYVFEPTAVARLDTPSLPRSTQNYRSADAEEASIVASYFNAHPEYHVKPPSPQHTQPPSRTVKKIEPTNPESIAIYFNEYPERLLQPSANPKVDEVGHSGPTTTDKHSPMVNGKAVATSTSFLPHVSTFTTTPGLIFTRISTTVSGISSVIPAYIIPSFSIATIGQAITLDGNPITLSAPNLLPTYIPTTVNGMSTSTLVHLISGLSPATVRQTVTMDGQARVLEVPSVVFAQIPTTMNGIATSSPVYIIDGSSTATMGQEVTVNGTPSVLAAPNFVATYVPTTNSGVATSTLVYVLDHSALATIGQTVTLDGKTTVLSEPADLENNVLRETSAVEGHEGAASGCRVSWNAVLTGLAALIVVCL